MISPHKVSKVKKNLEKNTSSVIEVNLKAYDLTKASSIMDILQDLRQLLGAMEKLLEVSCVLNWTPSTQKELKMSQKFLDEIVNFARRVQSILKIYPDGQDSEVRETIGIVIRGLVLKNLNY